MGGCQMLLREHIRCFCPSIVHLLHAEDQPSTAATLPSAEKEEREDRLQGHEYGSTRVHRVRVRMQEMQLVSYALMSLPPPFGAQIYCGAPQLCISVTASA